MFRSVGAKGRDALMSAIAMQSEVMLGYSQRRRPEPVPSACANEKLQQLLLF